MQTCFGTPQLTLFAHVTLVCPRATQRLVLLYFVGGLLQFAVLTRYRAHGAVCLSVPIQRTGVVRHVDACTTRAHELAIMAWHVTHCETVVAQLASCDAETHMNST